MKDNTLKTNPMTKQMTQAIANQMAAAKGISNATFDLQQAGTGKYTTMPVVIITGVDANGNRQRIPAFGYYI